MKSVIIYSILAILSLFFPELIFLPLALVTYLLGASLAYANHYLALFFIGMAVYKYLTRKL